MNKIIYYLIGILIIASILLFIFVQVPGNSESDKSNLEIYDSVDQSVNNFLAGNSGSQDNLYDAVDSSVEQFLNE